MNELYVLIAFNLLCFAHQAVGIPYQVFVYTGDVFSAGTDARVFMTIFGDDGKSREIELNSNRNDFERAHVDKFKLDIPNLGRLKKMNIRHDDTWFGSGWFLDKVEIKDTDGCVYVFPCHKWLATNVPDGQVSRNLSTKSECPPREISRKSVVCRHSLGIRSGLIENEQMTASSSYDDKHQPFHGRLKKVVKGSRGGWCSAFADDTEFLQVDFKNLTSVQGISTQGQAMFDNWVTSYTISYSTNGTTWKNLKEHGKIRNFTGNTDRRSVITYWFPEIMAKTIRVRPLSWNGLTNCMRIELYGCIGGSEKDFAALKKKAKIRKKEKQIINTKLDSASSSIIDKAVVYLRFEKIVKNNIIRDDSDLHNDARIVNFARLSRFSQKCGRGVDLNGGDILLNGERFVNKPREAITIAAWVKLFTVDGPNSIFDTIGGMNSTHRNGQYHFEVDGGSVRWFHRNEHGNIIFNVTTEVIVPPHIWTHVAGTYDAKTRLAEVYVNAKFLMREEGSGELSQDWQEKAGIGEHKGERLLDGLLDEFLISDKALTQDEVKELMKQCEFEKECFNPIGMEDMKIKDDQITASSTLQPHKAYYGRLNLISFYDDPKRSAWCSDDDDKEPYITVDLKDEMTISGVAIQGASVTDSFVTSFKLCYSHSGRKYNCVTENGTGEALLGNDDKDNIKIHWLNKFFDARYVRFYPLSWYGDSICMRTELYGCITGLLSDTLESYMETEIDPAASQMADCSVSCGKGTIRRVTPCTKRKEPKCLPGKKKYVHRVPCVRPSCPDCFSPVGMSSGSVDDSSISGSPSLDQAHAPFFGRVITAKLDTITRRGSWCAKHGDDKQFIEVDLDKPIKVTGIGTQGQVTADHWVTKYRIAYSINRFGWNNYTENYRPKIFSGNDDKVTTAIRHLKHPVTARYIRVYPLTWHGGLICMRVQIYGCDHGSNSLTELPKKLPKGLPERKSMPSGALIIPKPQIATFWNITPPRTNPVLSSRGKDTKSGAVTTSKKEQNDSGISKLKTKQLSNKHSAGTSRFHVLNIYENSRLNSNFLSENQESITPESSRTFNVQKHAKPLLPVQSHQRKHWVQVHYTKQKSTIVSDFEQNKKLLAHLPKAERKDVVAKKASEVHPTGISEYDWSEYGACSVTCGRGVKERYRKCNAVECIAEGTETEMLPCFKPPCKASTEWSGYTTCTVTCGVGRRTRSRQCDGVECPKTGKEIATISCRKPVCPILNLDFEAIEGDVIVDQSDMGNNAYLGKDSRVVRYHGICGHYVDLGGYGNVLLEDLTFRRKPKYGISVAGWVNLQTTSSGSHSIFSTARAINIGEIIGGYHFEIDDGKVRWFHRSRVKDPVFSVTTADVIRSNVWFHVAGTYSSTAMKAKVYVDGELRASAPGYGLLDDDWGYKAAVGSFDFDGRFLQAKLDDFYIFDYEISPKQIQGLLSIKCPGKKRN